MQMRSTRVNKAFQSVSFASPHANNCESQDDKESTQGEGDRKMCRRRWVMNEPSTSCVTCRACKTTCPKVRMPRRHGSKARVDANANDEGSSMSPEQAVRRVVLACPHATSSECYGDKKSKQGEGDRETCKRRWVMNEPSTSFVTCRACKTTCPKVRMPRRQDANANDDGSSMSLEQALRLACPHATSSEC